LRRQSLAEQILATITADACRILDKRLFCPVVGRTFAAFGLSSSHLVVAFVLFIKVRPFVEDRRSQRFKRGQRVSRTGVRIMPPRSDVTSICDGHPAFSPRSRRRAGSVTVRQTSSWMPFFEFFRQQELSWKPELCWKLLSEPVLGRLL
jgi:hypothetical protein